MDSGRLVGWGTRDRECSWSYRRRRGRRLGVSDGGTMGRDHGMLEMALKHQGAPNSGGWCAGVLGYPKAPLVTCMLDGEMGLDLELNIHLIQLE